MDKFTAARAAPDDTEFPDASSRSAAQENERGPNTVLASGVIEHATGMISEVADEAIEGALPVAFVDDLQRVADYARRAKQPSTEKQYARDFRLFEIYCASVGQSALPADARTVAAYLMKEAARGLKVATIERRRAAIRYHHRLARQPDPTDHDALRMAMQGVRNVVGTARRKKRPLTIDKLEQALHTIPEGLIGKRDRALLLLGFAGAFRRSELVGLTVEDLQEASQGMDIKIRRSKTDPTARGATVSILRAEKDGQNCPVAALKEWLLAAKIFKGPVFRPVGRGGRVQERPLSGHAVACVVKHYTRAAGIEDHDEFSGHSLRRGFLTTAADNGADIFKMRDHARHRTIETTKEYVDNANRFVNHPGKGIF